MRGLGLRLGLQRGKKAVAGIILPPTVPGKMGAPSLAVTAPTTVETTRVAFGDDGGSPITSWDAQIRQFSNGAWAGWGTLVSMAANLTVRSFFSRTAGVPYQTRTRAVNAVGVGEWSDESNTVTISTVPAKMLPPTGMVLSTSSIDLTRSEFQGDGGSPITLWNIQQRTSTTGSWGSFRTVDPASIKNRVYTSLVANTPYQFRTQAQNANGVGDWSEASEPIVTALPFSPADLNPVFWIDAMDTATITMANDRVSQINDKGSGKRNYAQATADRQFAYTASHPAANNKPALYAVTNNASMSTPNSLAITEHYFVAAYATGIEAMFAAADQPSGGGGFPTLIGGSGSNGQPRLLGQTGTAAFNTSNAMANGLVSKNGAAESLDVLPMPLSVIRATDTVGNSGTTFTRYLGNQSLGNNRVWPGPICEHIGFTTALSTEDRAKLLAHLKAKWGTP